MTATIEEDFEFIPKSRQKAEEVAKGLYLFGKETFTPEQIEKVREPLRKTLTSLCSLTCFIKSEICS